MAELDEEELEAILISRTEYDRLIAALEDRDRLRAALIGLQDAFGDHNSHWDPTMRHGQGCKQCDREREARSVVRAALEGRNG